MAQIILASNSKARLALLRRIGLRPRVIVSRAPEKPHHRGGCAALVKHNALIKARNVAGRLSRGIVIGCDTVVLADKKVIGKPKNKAEAFRTLKLLMRKRQWVYSGIAVIDVASGRTLTAYDKTRVYMRSAKDHTIRAYINSVEVKRLAGSFDIQGKGAVFVTRIEGCYYNVVGLPLAKLAVILEKLKFRV